MCNKISLLLIRLHNAQMISERRFKYALNRNIANYFEFLALRDFKLTETCPMFIHYKRSYISLCSVTSAYEVITEVNMNII